MLVGGGSLVNPPEIIPDYNAGIDVAANTEFSVPTNGMLAVSVFHYDHANNKLIINGATVFNVFMTGSYANGVLPPVTYPVRAGDTAISVAPFVFYPYK